MCLCVCVCVCVCVSTGSSRLTTDWFPIVVTTFPPAYCIITNVEISKYYFLNTNTSYFYFYLGFDNQYRNDFGNTFSIRVNSLKFMLMYHRLKIKNVIAYVSQILVMNFGSFTTRGHSPITWTFTPHSYRSLIDCISHHPLHQHSCSQWLRLHLFSISQSPSHTHTHTT